MASSWLRILARMTGWLLFFRISSARTPMMKAVTVNSMPVSSSVAVSSSNLLVDAALLVGDGDARAPLAVKVAVAASFSSGLPHLTQDECREDVPSATEDASAPVLMLQATQVLPEVGFVTSSASLPPAWLPSTDADAYWQVIPSIRPPTPLLLFIHISGMKESAQTTPWQLRGHARRLNFSTAFTPLAKLMESMAALFSALRGGLNAISRALRMGRGAVTSTRWAWYTRPSLVVTVHAGADGRGAASSCG